jgi:hypothetical protein
MDTSSNINDDPEDPEPCSMNENSKINNDSEDQRKTKETCTSANDGTSDQLAYVGTLYEPLQGEEVTVDEDGKSVEVVTRKSKSSTTDKEIEVEDFVKDKANSDDFSGIHTILFRILP